MPSDEQALSAQPAGETNPYAAPQPVLTGQPLSGSGGGEKLSPELFDELQRVANYRHVRKTLRPGGIASMVFGAINIAVGLDGLKYNPINIILVAIGALLLAEGLWLVIAPVAVGIIIDGIALLLVGVWNIFVSVFNAANGGGPGGFTVIAIVQIVWGIQAFGRYRRFSKMPQEKPPPDMLRRIDQIVKDIQKSKPATDPQIVEFQGKSFAGKQRWKGRLRDGVAVFVGSVRHDLVFARPNDVEFSKQGKVLLGKTLKASFRIADRSFNGLISPESFGRYEAWKAPAPAT